MKDMQRYRHMRSHTATAHVHAAHVHSHRLVHAHTQTDAAIATTCGACSAVLAALALALDAPHLVVRINLVKGVPDAARMPDPKQPAMEGHRRHTAQHNTQYSTAQVGVVFSAWSCCTQLLLLLGGKCVHRVKATAPHNMSVSGG